MTRFSIVIPTYGRQELLGDAIGSVLRQTLSDWELIVVDDGSLTPVGVDCTDQRVRLLRTEENQGPAAARNVGVSAAEGDVLCFLDSDDIYAPDRLELAASGLATADIALCWSRWLGSSVSSRIRHSGMPGSALFRQTTPGLGQVAVRREAWRPLDPTFVASQDVEWWARVGMHLQVETVAAVGVLYRRHDGERNLNGTKARLEASHRLIEMYPEVFQADRRALSFRRRTMSRMATQIGDVASARRYALDAVRACPTPRAVATAWRSMRPNRQGG